MYVSMCVSAYVRVLVRVCVWYYVVFAREDNRNYFYFLSYRNSYTRTIYILYRCEHNKHTRQVFIRIMKRTNNTVNIEFENQSNNYFSERKARARVWVRGGTRVYYY